MKYPKKIYVIDIYDNATSEEMKNPCLEAFYNIQDLPEQPLDVAIYKLERMSKHEVKITHSIK